jgi:hypothetical protein
VRRAGRRDANESTILTVVEPLGGFWLPTGPFDGWLWDRSKWNLCEVKDPSKEGWKDEFTADQKKLIIQLNERQLPWHALRTEDDVLKLLNGRKSA